MGVVLRLGAARRLPSLVRASSDAELDYRHEAGVAPTLIDTVRACNEWVELVEHDNAHLEPDILVDTATAAAATLGRWPSRLLIRRCGRQ